MTMRCAHMVTGHLHQAMTDFGAKDGTKPGTAGTVSHRIANGDNRANI
jgi:hypothetical protein